MTKTKTEVQDMTFKKRRERKKEYKIQRTTLKDQVLKALLRPKYGY